MKRIILLMMITTLTGSLLANNLVIENISITDQNASSDYTHIEFDVSWDNSWRTSTGTPYNYDGVWVFAKWQDDGGNWSHCTLSTTSGDHTNPTGSNVEAVSDGKGVFMYKSTDDQFGSNNWDNARLRWEYGTDGVADAATVTVKVFALEMVNIPQGAYYAGDGSSVDNAYTEERITSADASTDAGSPDLASGLTANYPNGYNAFWLQKHEASQGQYVDFLNTLTRAQQNSRTGTDVSTDAITNVYVMSNNSAILYRNDITCPSSGNGTTNPIIFTANIPDRACNMLNWDDTKDYCDWAALRPMTELEYEKACRGDNDTDAGSYAWGNTSIAGSAYTLSNDGASNAAVSGNYASDPAGNCSYTTTDGSIDGPLRCGIFATSSSTRAEAGASYYGVLEMSGNLWEHLISDNDLDFTGELGDGNISALPSAWPGDSENKKGIRGGGYSYAASIIRVSSRSNATYNYSARSATVGLRPCR